MHPPLTTRQVAFVLGISEASLKRWCDRGVLPSARTVGGHRRLPVHGVVEFARSRGFPLAHPEVLGLPPQAGRGHAVVDRGRLDLRRALLAGDEEVFRRLAFDPWLAGQPLAEVLERGVVPALDGLGLDVLHGVAEIYQERRAIEICLRFLHEVRGLLPPPADDAPLAIGGSAEHDPYLLPAAMVDLCLREAGWRTQALGIGIPLSSLCAAVEAVRPDLFWLSVSAAPDREALVAGWAELQERAVALGTATVVGGRALDAALRPRMAATAMPIGLSGLQAWVRELGPSRIPG
ncbi:MAG: helix-turn-helix domain-containing protein [Planctomycetota bacterium]|nr:helix-turn-helix domain-containing protein [Planctomycetota bacterium]